MNQILEPELENKLERKAYLKPSAMMTSCFLFQVHHIVVKFNSFNRQCLKKHT